MTVGRKHLAAILAATFLGAAVLAVGVIMPAEFGIDPSGFGKATGLTRLAGGEPEKVTLGAQAGVGSFPSEMRTDSFNFAVGRFGELEFKVLMRAGEVLIYSWRADNVALPTDLTYDFHGENWPRAAEEKVKVAEYEQRTGTSANGSLIAPFDGVHGWYFKNDGRLTNIHLTLGGFYRLIPPGIYGNEDGIEPLPTGQ